MTTSFADKPVVQSATAILEKGFYPLVVEYGEWWTVCRACRFSDRHPDINPQNFPIPIGPGGAIRDSVDIYLGYFNQMVETNEVLTEMKRLGFRPANFTEILALAAEFPSLQTEFPIVGLMAMGKINAEDVGIARLDKKIDWRETKRVLDCELFQKHKSWQPGIRFAMVKE